MKKIVLITCLLLSNFAKSQLPDKPEKLEFTDKIYDLILNESNANLKYTFIVEKSDTEEHELTYLGRILMNKSDTLKFLFSTSFSGLYNDSKRATSHLILYFNNKKVGMYYLGGVYKRTPKIENNRLFIMNQNDFCNQSTIIDFHKGIPSKIFINCKEEDGNKLGDLYNFNITPGIDEKLLPIIKLP